jgi:hypothetical protein
MATIDDVQAGILETRVYEGMLKDGKRLELTATLLDLHGDALPFASGIRDRGAQAFGMLFFDTSSPVCPQLGVTWQRFDSGLEVVPDDSERHFLDNEAFLDLCVQIMVNFLSSLAERDAKYAWLAPPRMH